MIPCACATARQLARVLTQMYDEKLRPSGVEAPQFALLMTLDQMGSASQTDLCRFAAIDKTTMSRNLKWMEHKGWIEAAKSIDKRQRRFKLSRRGKGRLKAATPHWQKAQDQLQSGIRAKQWDAMFEVLRSVTSAATHFVNA